MRKRFQGELEKLHKMLLKMDMTIKSNIDMMLTALKNNDRQLAKEVIESDDLVDKLEIEIEEFCIDIIIRQQPVAGDLREITSVLKMITDLERISDYSASVCEHFLDIKLDDNVKCMKKIIKLGKNAKQMFIGMIKGHMEQNDEKLKKVNEQDSVSDEIFEDLKNNIIRDIDIIGVENSINFILMGRALERMADHITNICDWIHYKMTGKFKI